MAEPATLEGRVALVTGAGGGIGGAVAEQLARLGAVVVCNDRGVGLDGSDIVDSTAAATATRIDTAGGRAVPDTTSVTDADAFAALVERTTAEVGPVDVLVNAAGFARAVGLPDTTEEDWRSVLDVHLGGHLHTLTAILPGMVERGFGRIVNVTSGAGLARISAEAPSYAAAKRAVASLTWELGRITAPGVAVSAVSPIARTRMAVPPAGAVQTAATAPALDFSAMPAPEGVAALFTHLACSPDTGLHGAVAFGNGDEVALMDPPRLVEAVDVELVAACHADVLGLLVAAERAQVSGGGGMPRLADGGAPAGSGAGPDAVRRVVVVLTSGATTGAAVGRWLTDHGHAVTTLTGPASTFADAEARLRAATAQIGGVDAVVVLTADAPEPGGTDGYDAVLATHCGVTDRVVDAAAWARAASVAHDGRPPRVVLVTPATTAAGRTTAQAIVQLARSASATPGVGAHLALADESRTGDGTLAAAVGVLATSELAEALAGAELMAGQRSIGLRAHPRAGTTFTFPGPTIPGWVDLALRAACNGA